MTQELTVVVLIGNSDDKLPQARWSSFVETMREVVAGRASVIHFEGHSNGDARWQNWCIVATVNLEWMPSLQAAITQCRREYDQDSAAVLIGNTGFL